jgi:hypothetical protein
MFTRDGCTVVVTSLPALSRLPEHQEKLVLRFIIVDRMVRCNAPTIHTI